MKRERDNKAFFSVTGSLLLLLLTIGLMTAGISKLSHRTDQEEMEILVQAIHRASIQCYAIEGRYPPSVEYLENHYGIIIDRQKYQVFYDGFASNVMPEITVIPVLKIEQGE